MTTEVTNAVATEAMKEAVTNAAMDVTTQVANQALVTAKTSAIDSAVGVINNNRTLIKWIVIFGVSAAIGYYLITEEKKKRAAQMQAQQQIAQQANGQTLTVPIEAQVKEPVKA